MDQNEFENMSEELLSLAGLWKVLKDINVDQKIILDFKDGSKITGTKRYFDEEAGIIAILSTFEVPRQSSLQTEKVVMDKEHVYLRYRLTEIKGVGTFPKM